MFVADFRTKVRGKSGRVFWRTKTKLRKRSRSETNLYLKSGLSFGTSVQDRTNLGKLQTVIRRKSVV